MRTTRRAALAAAALALGFGTLLISGAPAGASGETEGACFIEAVEHAETVGEEKGLTHEEIEEEVEAGITECRAAASPILPEVNEIIWGSFGFLVVLGFVMWQGYPAVKKTMDARTEKIRGDIEGAESAKAEADQVLAQYHAQLADARNESARILEEARQDADAVRTERIAAIDGEIADMRQRAAADVEASKAQALADLRGEITALALGAAERVIEHNLDDATNRALIDSYIDSVGTSS